MEDIWKVIRIENMKKNAHLMAMWADSKITSDTQ